MCKPSIYIITEGFQNTGYGHTTRCLSISQALNNLKHRSTLIVNGDKGAETILNNRNSLFFNWLENHDKLLTEITGAEIVIIDSYLSPLSLYEKIAKKVKKAIYIDDTLRLNYPKGIVVNGGINAEELSYPPNENIKYLLGIKYQPLRKAFWKNCERKKQNKISDILITMGGSDIRNLSSRILHRLTSEFPHIRKRIIIGSGLSKKFVDIYKDNNTIFYFNLDDKKMRQVMLMCDFAITAAGQTLYELAVTQTPSVVVGIADNQKNNIEGWLKYKAICYAGWHYEDNIISKISSCASEFIKNPEKLFPLKKVLSHVINQDSTINLAKRIMNHA